MSSPALQLPLDAVSAFTRGCIPCPLPCSGEPLRCTRCLQTTTLRRVLRATVCVGRRTKAWPSIDGAQVFPGRRSPWRETAVETAASARDGRTRLRALRRSGGVAGSARVYSFLAGSAARNLLPPTSAARRIARRHSRLRRQRLGRKSLPASRGADRLRAVCQRRSPSCRKGREKVGGSSRTRRRGGRMRPGRGVLQRLAARPR
jgi:hypothetical protein